MNKRWIASRLFQTTFGCMQRSSDQGRVSLGAQ